MSASLAAVRNRRRLPAGCIVAGAALLLVTLATGRFGAAGASSAWRRVAAPPSIASPPPATPPRAEGRLLFEARLADGHVAIATAHSGFGPDYEIRIEAEATRSPVQRHRLGFATELFAAEGEAVYYATLQARLGKVTAAGGLAWERVLGQTPTALAASAQGIAVGDRSGAISYRATDGTERWRTNLSRRAIVGLAVDPEAGIFVAWDDQAEAWWGVLASGRIVAHENLPAGVRTLARERAGWSLHDDHDRWWRRDAAPAAGTFTWLHAGAWLGLGLMAAGAASLFWQRPAWREALRRCWHGRAAYLFLAPGLALLALFELWPVAAAALDSLYAFNLTSPPRFVGAENFRHLVHDPYVHTGLANMAWITAAAIMKTLAFPLLAAELVFWLAGERIRAFYRVAFLLPAVVPGLVTVLLWKMIYDPQVGFLNSALRALGWERHTHAWLGEPGTALGAVIFTGFPWISIVAFLVLLGGLMRIETSIFEAGEIDGAGVLGRFWRIDLPLLLPQIRLLTVLAVIGGIQEFASILVMTRGGPGLATYVPALHMFLETAEGVNLGYASAIGVVLFAIVITATLLLNRSFEWLEQRIGSK